LCHEWSGSRLVGKTGSYPETGFAEINGDLPEADLWTGVSQSHPITSELPVIRAQSTASTVNIPGSPDCYRLHPSRR
jgi:hypothetical protein